MHAIRTIRVLTISPNSILLLLVSLPIYAMHASDLAGRVPIHPAAGEMIGATGGQAQVQLGAVNLPAHVHDLSTANGTTDSTGDAVAVGTAQPWLAVNFIIAVEEGGDNDIGRILPVGTKRRSVYHIKQPMYV